MLSSLFYYSLLLPVIVYKVSGGGGDSIENGQNNTFLSNCTCMEKEDCKPFRNALGKSDKKKFDEMFDIPDFTFQRAPLILYNT